jgi:nucleotide-binding universal stress UspA family protein
MPFILSFTDGSIYSASVYDYSAWAARQLGASVHVLHMLEPRRKEPVPDWSGSIGLDAQNRLMEQIVSLAEAQGRVALAKADAILAEARKRLEEAGVSEFNAEAKHGTLIEAVEQFEPGADLVVIGKRGEAADFNKLHLGANLERVIRSCRHPVLVASRAYAPIQRMLIAYDGGPSARKAVEYAANEPLLKGIACLLLFVGSAKPGIEAELEQARQRLAAAGYSAEASIVPGSPEEVFAETIKREGIGLLVMGAYGHSRIRQFIVGSTTTTMVRTCQVPVLMFR